MVNPDKYIRKYFYDYLSNEGFNIFDSSQGVDNQDFCVLLSTQSKNIEYGNKCVNNWDSTILIEIIERLPNVGNTGSRVKINDAENEINVAYELIELDDFKITTKAYQTTDLVTYGLNEIINRVIITINLKLYEL
jgi:hypothetical protein